MDIIKTVKYRGYKIEIYQDTLLESPRTEFSNMGTMACFHKRYILGDEDHGYSIEEVKKIEKSDKYISLPVYLYDHSGTRLKTTPFSCPWDSGQVGVIFVSKEDVRKEFKVKAISKKLREKVLRALKREVELLDQWGNGQVYGFEINEKDDFSTNWTGFYGDIDGEVVQCAKEEIDFHLSKKQE